MIIGLLLFLGLMHLCGIVPILLVIAEVEFPSIFERYWKSAGFVGKTFVILLLILFLPIILLYLLGLTCINIYCSFTEEDDLLELYSIMDACGVKVVLPESNVLDLLRENKIPFSIGAGFIRFPDNETLDTAKEFLGSYKIYEE